MNNIKINDLNIQEREILSSLMAFPSVNQRGLAYRSGYSLGIVNRSLKRLMDAGFITSDYQLTADAGKSLEAYRVKRAVILAAGVGMRMVPINTEVTKGLIEVKGETLIERLIRQLKEAGISEIYVIAGFMKEQYEFLIDKYGVKLVINMEYAVKNNLYSLLKVKDKLDSTYILPCDIWFRDNPFRTYELYPWYMLGDSSNHTSPVRLDRKYDIVRADKNYTGNTMVGLSFMDGEAGSALRDRLSKMAAEGIHTDKFWEDALWDNGKMIVKGRCYPDDAFCEINTYEQLRELDNNSEHLNSDIIDIVSKALKAEATDIVDIRLLKKGMTNRSFRFKCRDREYIMRIPGEGTDKLIDRKQEYDVYKAIEGKGICDDIYYINPDNGYKITAFIDNARTCDALDETDLTKSMRFLRDFHEKGYKVEHTFDLFKYIEFYETLWEGTPSVYRDYELTKKHVYELKSYVDAQPKEWVLTHIDANEDNFLIQKDGTIRLIDWEYAGMQDPHLDIAMFTIYSMYDREHVDKLIDIYFEGNVDHAVRMKIYCYIAIAGLLWSNWCEFKRHKGVEFGEYSLCQYRYAKEYYRIFMEER